LRHAASFGYTFRMRGRRFFISFLLFASFGFLSGEEGRPFPLAPLLETAASGELRWQPDWPPEIPPDAFSAGASGAAGDSPREIVLDGEAGTFTLRRDGAGRLRAFPFFFRNMPVQAEFEYGPAGGVTRLRVSAAGGEPWLFEFPGGFLPRGGGGSALSSPVKASRGGAVFYVFFLEAAGFLSETWYDGDGNFQVYYRAEMYRDASPWRIRSLEKRDSAGPGVEYRSFDSEGNITEISSPEGTFTALYRLKRPLYWDQTGRAAPADTAANNVADTADRTADTAPSPDSAGEQAAGGANSFVLQWDERGFLTLMKYAGANGSAECRYEYEEDSRGNWIRRQALSMRAGFGLLIPGSGVSWSRRIGYQEAVSAGEE
jgi:hypothetical protein